MPRRALPLALPPKLARRDLLLFFTWPTRRLLEPYLDGAAPEQLAADFDLPLAKVRRTLAYALDRLRRLEQAAPASPSRHHHDRLAPHEDVLRRRPDLHRFLTREQRQLVRQFLDGVTQVQIARARGTTKETVCIMLGRARRRVERYERLYPAADAGNARGHAGEAIAVGPIAKIPFAPAA